MLSQYIRLFHDDNFAYKDVFKANASVIINQKIQLLSIEQIESYYQELKNGLSCIDYKVTNIMYNSENHINFTWMIDAKHTGVFLSFLPTQKMVSFSGMTSIQVEDEKICKVHVFFNEKDFEDQISLTSGKIFKPEEVFNNLNGPAQKIYKVLLSTRPTFTDSKQVLVDALRKSVLRAPDLSLLNKEVIADLKEKTTLIKEKMSLTNQLIDLFIYTPKGEEYNTDLTTILYLHGGGWCIGSPEGYDMTNRKLALTTHARVICPRYRLCPEHPYPAGFDDCCEVYLNLRKFLPSENKFYVNPAKIIVAGDSAGGGFAAALTLRMHDENQPLPNGLMLLSPATDMRVENYESYNEYTRNNIMIDQGTIGFLRGCYIQGDMWDNSYVSPIRGDLSCFPKTFVMIGEEDPLYDENIALSNKISQSSNYECVVLIGKGMPHHYHTFVGLAEEVEEAYQKMSSFLKDVII